MAVFGDKPIDEYAWIAYIVPWPRVETRDLSLASVLVDICIFFSISLFFHGDIDDNAI